MLTIAKFSYVVVASFSFLTFRALHHFFKAKIPLPPGPSASKQWLYYNTLLSLIHACISSTWTIYCFHDKPAILSDMLVDWNLPSYYLLAFMTGYIVHDSLDIVINDFKGSTGLIIHHIAVSVVTVFALSTKRYITLATSLLLMEFNSIFLHIRRLMRFHGVKPSTLAYKINIAGLFVTFITLRFVLLIWLSAYFVHKGRTIPWSHYLLGITGLLCLMVVNMILFLRLFKTEFSIFSKRNKGHTNNN